MIIVGGFNTYPAEIENFFLRHPKVLDVSIVGVPDPIMGEAVMAFVIPKAGETLTPEEIVAFARGKIANFKVPKYVEIVEQLPADRLREGAEVQAEGLRGREVRARRALAEPASLERAARALPSKTSSGTRRNVRHHVRIEVGARGALDLDRAPLRSEMAFE